MEFVIPSMSRTGVMVYTVSWHLCMVLIVGLVFWLNLEEHVYLFTGLNLLVYNPHGLLCLIPFF